MKNPKQWMRARAWSFVHHAINETTLQKDLDQLHQRLLLVEATLQDDGWKKYIESYLCDASKHLTELESRINDLTGQLIDLNKEIKVIPPSIDGVALQVEALRAEFAIQSSRIRANPFQNDSLSIRSWQTGRETLGFTSVDGGNYVDFIGLFRPSFEDLVHQLQYVKQFLPTSGRAVDLGAGRGEMVEVLKSHGLDAIGIDADESVVNDAHSRGIDVRLSDIDSFLAGCDPSSLSVVTSIQVVEHVETTTLQSWLRSIRAALKDDGILVIETPNPHAIDAFKAFWLDVTHVRPYYPEALLHLAQAAGFRRAEIWVEGDQESVHDRLGFAGSYTLIAQA